MLNVDAAEVLVPRRGASPLGDLDILRTSKSSMSIMRGSANRGRGLAQRAASGAHDTGADGLQGTLGHSCRGPGQCAAATRH